jgi:hypothetical protein
MIPIEKLRSMAEIAKNSYKTSKELYIKEAPAWYYNEMTRLGEKYRSIRWLPLDIPKFEFENYHDFLALWDKESIPILRTRPDSAEPWNKEDHPLGEESHWYKPGFRGIFPYVSNTAKFEEVPALTWTSKYFPHPIFDPMIEHVKKYFPFHFVDHMYIWESVKEIDLHTDQTQFWNCPTEFRIMLHDDNPQPTLFVADMEHVDINYIDLPSDTNSFCWSNGTQMHGSDFFGKRKQLLVVNGILSISKLEALIDRSIEKYKKQLNYKLEI